MPPDPTKQTSCKHCVFAIYDNKTQTGCEADRIKKFDDIIEAYDNDREFYVINRLCNLHRTEKWNDGIKDITKAKNESCLTFDLLINCDAINSDYVSKIKDEINNISYPSYKYKLVFYHSHELMKDGRQLVSDLHKAFPSSTISMYFEKAEYLQSFIYKTKNSFHVLIDSNNIDGIGKFLEKVNNLINEDLKRFVLCKGDHKIALSNIACRIIYPQLYLDYDNTFSEIEKQSKEENLFTEF